LGFFLHIEFEQDASGGAEPPEAFSLAARTMRISCGGVIAGMLVGGTLGLDVENFEFDLAIMEQLDERLFVSGVIPPIADVTGYFGRHATVEDASI
jgi:hypothetical protein